MPTIKDGVNYPLGKNVPPPASTSPPATPARLRSGASSSSLAGPALGVSARQVPDVATLLFGPLARGSQVSVR